MLIFLIACASSPPAPKPVEAVPEPTTPKVEAPKVETLLGETVGVNFVGDWTSPACAGRTYARNLRFDSDSNWAAVDMVSPCPAGTTCVWSGLVTMQGIWEYKGETVETRVIGGGTQTGPSPTSFRSNEKGELVEDGCVYTKGFTVPEGYDAAKVTPTIQR